MFAQLPRIGHGWQVEPSYLGMFWHSSLVGVRPRFWRRLRHEQRRRRRKTTPSTTPNSIDVNAYNKTIKTTYNDDCSQTWFFSSRTRTRSVFFQKLHYSPSHWIEFLIDPQLSAAKRHQRTQLFTNSISHASLERQLLQAQTARVEAETKLRERELQVERLERDRRHYADREKEEREAREREQEEHAAEKVCSCVIIFCSCSDYNRNAQMGS